MVGVRSLTEPKRFVQTCLAYLGRIRSNLLRRPMLGMTVDLMVDAPLFGLGLWGLCAAWRLAKQRRDARGVFVLLVTAALLAVWLLTGSYALSLGLCLCFGCALREADLGKKRWAAILLTLAGIVWYACIQIAGWYFPLPLGLLERLV